MIKACDFRIRKSNTLIYLLLFFYLLFVSQGTLFPANFFITNILSIVYSAICFCFLVACNIHNRNLFVSWLSLFVIIHTINFVFTQRVYFSISGNPITGLFTIKNTYIALLGFFPFYYFYKKKRPSFTPIIIFLMLYAMIVLIKFLTRRVEAEMIERGDMMSNNAGYGFVTLLPFAALFLRRRFVSLMMILFSIVFVIGSMKRGAILVGGGAVLVYFYYSLKNVNLSRHQRTINILSIVGGVIIVGAVAYLNYISNTNLQERFSTISEGSGRDWIYENLFSIWLFRSEILDYLFGYGINATVRFVGFFAHNDWLELLMSLGILGIISYVVLLACLFNQSKKIVIYSEKIALKMILFIWCVTSLFSMFYFEVNSFVYLMLIGMIIGKNDRFALMRLSN